jgi:hypothetical protein
VGLRKSSTRPALGQHMQTAEFGLDLGFENARIRGTDPHGGGVNYMGVVQGKAQGSP